MKKMTVLIAVVALLLLAGCGAQPSGGATTSVMGSTSSAQDPKDYKYPGDAAKGLLDQYGPLIPEEIFTTTGEENGLVGTMYLAIGSVERYIEEPEGYPVFVVINTIEGDIVVMDPVEGLKSQPDLNTMLTDAGLDKLRDYYPLPGIGDFVSITVEYQGMSDTYGCPLFVYGTSDYMLETIVEVAMLGGIYAKESDSDGLTQPSGGGQTSTDPTEPDSPTAPPDSAATSGNGAAVKEAKEYLRIMAFSRSGLIGQLEYEGYSKEDATYAVDNCGADWNEQAVRSAKEYLEHQAFSYTGLIKQLEYEGFSTDQATHGVNSAGADWNEQAKKSAANYLTVMPFSREELISQLEYEGFTHSQAVYGVDANGL